MGQDQSIPVFATSTSKASTSVQGNASSSPGAGGQLAGAGTGSSTGASKRAGQPDGVHLVQGSGSGLRNGDGTSVEADEILSRSNKLPIPQPLLPRPSADDTITSALQGTKMIQELKTLFDGLAVTVDETSTSLSNQLGRISSSAPLPLIDQLRSGFNVQQQQQRQETKENDQKGKGKVKDKDKDKEEQEQKEREKETQVLKLIGIDPIIVQNILDDCTGGNRMDEVIEQQNIILRRITEMSTLATRLKSTAQLNTEQAKKTTKAIEILDRLSLSISDLADSLEQVVATSNILGAAHFADDDEMCSFKNYLQHNPPQL